MTLKTASASGREPGKTCVPQPGDIIRVRTRTWLTEHVEPSPAGTIVEAVCLDDDAQGQPLTGDRARPAKEIRK
jgi:hypothetical protein